jgi:hypothetical protein
MSEVNGIASGRGTNGWFAKGNKLGTGNGMHMRMRRMRTALLDASSEDDIREIYRSLMDSARAGDTAAAKVLLEYLCGKPTQGIELSGPGGEPLAMGAILAVVKDVLADHPEAQVKLAGALHRLGRSRDGRFDRSGSGDGPGVADGGRRLLPGPVAGPRAPLEG